MFKQFGVLFLLTCLGMIAGCANQEEHLKSAIAAKISTDGNPLACADLLNDVGSFPFAYHMDGMLNHGANKKVLDQLVSNGFLSSKNIKVKSVYGGLNGEVVGLPDAVEYSVTNAGQKYLQGNKLCIPSEMASTEVDTDDSRRNLKVTQYFSAVKNDETEKLSKLLVPLNPKLGQLMEKDLPLTFQVKISTKNDILSVEKTS